MDVYKFKVESGFYSLDIGYLLVSIAGPGYFYFDYITESFHEWESFKHPLFSHKTLGPRIGATRLSQLTPIGFLLLEE